MSEAPFDPSTLDVEAAPAPEHVTPDHRASSNRPPWMNRSTKPPDRNQRGPRKSVPPSRPGEFVEPVASLYRGVAAMALPFDYNCAMVVLEVDNREELSEGTPNPDYGKDRAQICAEALDNAAQKSEGLRRFLNMVTKGGTWGMVIAAHMPIAMTMLAHHTPLMERMTRQMMNAPASSNGHQPHEQ